MSKTLIIFTDGASRGNPGQSSYGFTISDSDGQLVYEEGEYLGINTNNFAEYSAVLAALSYVRDHLLNARPLKVNFFMDSKLAREQLSGNYKIKSPNLIPLILQIKKLEQEVGEVTFTHVPREKNKRADALANLALDKRIRT